MYLYSFSRYLFPKTLQEIKKNTRNTTLWYQQSSVVMLKLLLKIQLNSINKAVEGKSAYLISVLLNNA